MSQDADELTRLLDSQPKPLCAGLTPFTIVDARFDIGFVKLEFAPQPAFRNYFANIQGDFAVAMLDVVVSMAAYARCDSGLPPSRLNRASWSQFQSGPALRKAGYSKPAAVSPSLRVCS